MLLGVAWRNKTLSVHLHGVDVGSRLTRRGRQALHLQEGLDVLHFWLVGAVGHCLAFGGEDACSFPLGVLCLLQQRENNSYAMSPTFVYVHCIMHYVYVNHKKCSEACRSGDGTLHCHIGCTPHSSHQQLGAGAWCQTSCLWHWHQELPHNLSNVEKYVLLTLATAKVTVAIQGRVQQNFWHWFGLQSLTLIVLSYDQYQDKIMNLMHYLWCYIILYAPPNPNCTVIWPHIIIKKWESVLFPGREMLMLTRMLEDIIVNHGNA